MKAILNQVKEDGWNLNEDYIEEHLGEKSWSNTKALVNELLNCDLKDCGSPSLPSEANKGKTNQLSTPIILQVANVRNVSAPKSNEESGVAPQLLKITLTDGTSYIHGLEMQSVPSLSVKTAPGTKVKLVAKVPLMAGYLLLTTANTQVLGGKVSELYDKWKMSQSVSKYGRGTFSGDGSGPPNWVPFGQSIAARKETNFKALDSTSAKSKDDEFESQRKLVVQEIAQGSAQKVFGGGKQMLDSNIQKVISAGFTVQEAEWALRKNRNDAHKAIHELRSNCSGSSWSNNTTNSDDDAGRRGKQRGRGRGRGRGAPGDSGDEDYTLAPASTRPSGPASLLDYLESSFQDKRKDQPAPSSFLVDHRSSLRGGGSSYRDRDEREKSNRMKQGESLESANWPALQENCNSQTNSAKKQPDTDKSSITEYREQKSRNEHRGQPDSSINQSASEEYSYNGKEQAYPSRSVISEDPVQQARDSYDSNHNNQGSGYRRYDNGQPNSYEHYQSYSSYEETNNGSSRPNSRYARRPTRPVYTYGRGMQRDYNRYQDQRFPNPNHANPNHAVYQSSNNSYRDPRDIRPSSDELIAQFEKSMVMAGYYDPAHLRNENRQFPVHGGYARENFGDNRYPPSGPYSQEFYGSSLEYHRGGGGFARGGGGSRPRYGRGNNRY